MHHVHQRHVQKWAIKKLPSNVWSDRVCVCVFFFCVCIAHCPLFLDAVRSATNYAGSELTRQLRRGEDKSLHILLNRKVALAVQSSRGLLAKMHFLLELVRFQTKKKKRKNNHSYQHIHSNSLFLEQQQLGKLKCLWCPSHLYFKSLMYFLLLFALRCIGLLTSPFAIFYAAFYACGRGFHVPP